jgi:DNA-binding IclR family transcriptional regulator
MQAQGGVQLIEKVAAVLDALEAGGELTAAELATATGEPRSSVYRLLATLEALGYVEPGDRRGGVRLGLRLFQLGTAVSRRFDLRERALPSMRDLQRVTGETVMLMVRRGRDAVCIERLDGRYVRLVIVDVGSSMPLHTGAAPRALLAFAPDDVVEAALTAPLAAYNERTLTDSAAIRRELAAARDAGYVVSDGDVVDGVASLGAPVRDQHGDVVASVSLAGPRPAILEGNAERTRELLLDACAHVSRALGWAGERRVLAG